FLLSGSGYRPGDDLLQTRMTVLPAHMSAEQIEAHRRYNPFFDGSYWPDGMARVAGREYNGLLESTCYQKGGMTCLSCHSMHHSDPDDQLSTVGKTNEACYQCHASYRENLVAHTRHQPESTGSQCYNCHMPHTTYGLFKAIRSHQITSPNVAVTLSTGRATACNLCHLDQTLGWSAEKLSEWYTQPAEQLTEEQRSYSAVGLWLLKGNAVERALASWIAGWRPATDASSRDWLAPVLATLLDDTSPVIRLVASRSLDAIDPRYARDYDFVSTADELGAARQRVLDLWKAAASGKSEKLPRRVFMDEHGQFDEELVQALIAERDNRGLRVSE
ncbi:MAG: cytochrome c3 family protein, partial [Pirellulales bacterium]